MERRMKVRDVMTTNPVCVTPDTPVAEIAELLLAKRISAVFVIDDSGVPLGVVSEVDLMHRSETGTEEALSSRRWWLRLVASPAALATEYAKTHGRRAQDVMTSPVFSVAEDMRLDEVATLLETRRIKRVPVVRNERVVGVVSRANLLRAWTLAKATDKTDEALDRSIRDQLMAELNAQLWASADPKNIIVKAGVVHLWGIVASEQERTATRIAAEAISGVRGVQDHLVVIPILQTR